MHAKCDAHITQNLLISLQHILKKGQTARTINTKRE